MYLHLKSVTEPAAFMFKQEVGHAMYNYHLSGEVVWLGEEPGNQQNRLVELPAVCTATLLRLGEDLHSV